MTPFEIVLQHYRHPEKVHGNDFIPHPLQVQAINERAVGINNGVFLDTGTGKTFVETFVALYRMVTADIQTTIIVMPPILVQQWAKWLSTIVPVGGRKPLKVCAYQGTPSERKAMSFEADFILVGIQIFKKDYDRFTEFFVTQRRRTYQLAADEATMLSNINSDNHTKVFDFAVGTPQDMLTGTPMNRPLDAYGLLKFTNPGAYRNFRQFQNIHVEEVDFYGNPSKFQNLELLRDNLATNASRILFEDMYPDIDQPLFTQLPYQLEPAHLKLYRRIAEEQLLLLPDGAKIDATSASRLTHALGQLIVNWGHFAGNPKLVSNTLAMIDDRIESLQGGKVVVFANYRMSIALITEHFAKKYKAVAINGDVTPAAKARALKQFIEDPACNLITIHPKSGGFGLDGMQHVSHHAVFAEPCQQPRDFHQCVARLKRTGQRKRVVVALPVAEGTIQVRGFNALLNNDILVNSVVRNAVDLRSAIFGQ